MAERCRHWVGIFDPANVARGGMSERRCAAGVRYAALAQATRPTEPEWNRRLPCWGDRDGAHPCEQRSLLTKDEREFSLRRLERVMEELPGLLDTIHAQCRRTGLERGSTQCPICGGRLNFTATERLGRRRSSGSCETPECFTWMT